MPDISKITGIALANIASLDSVAIANVGKVTGITKPSSVGPIAISDITVTDVFGNLSTTNPHSFDLPTTAGNGDFVLTIWTIDDPTSGLTVNPTGWTLANTSTWGNSTSDAHIKFLYRQLDGTEGSSVPCYSTISSTRGSIFYSMVVENIDTTTPIDAVSSPAIATGTGVTAPTVTSVNGGLLICTVAHDGADGSPFSFSNGSFTFTDGGDTGNAGQSFGGVSSAFKYATIGASTASSTTSITATTSDGKVAGHIILRQA
jgi:hypothetical protein